MAGLPRVLLSLSLVSLAGLANGIIPGLLLGQGLGGGKPLGGAGSPLLRGLFRGGAAGLGRSGAAPGSGFGAALGEIGRRLPTVKMQAGPGGIDAAGFIPGLLQARGTIGPHGGGAPQAGSPKLASLIGGGFPGLPLSGGGPAISPPVTQGASGVSGPALNVGESSPGTDRTVGSPPASAGAGSGSAGGNADSSEEDGTKKKKNTDGDGSSPGGIGGREKPAERPVEGRRRNKRSFMDEFGLIGTKGAHHSLDNVPDHVKVVYCGRHEVPNPGGIEDHFCHPDATWETLLRMRPDCVCQQGFLRNSWGECISPAECDHCSDKHHLNMDYHLCESPCPIVCNQPIDENCPNTCFKECACRPGYIRAYPNGPCVSIKQCLPGCRGRNQIFSLCSSLCPPTCRKPVPKRCPNICAGEGCVCKPGYVVKKWEPLVCVRPENCPGRGKKCPGPNQRYSRCIRRCAPSCFRRRHRYCGHDCLGRGCVCKRGYVVLQRRPLVCVRRDECPARRKKCPARNQVYMYCKSKCPRTCEEPKPRKCGSACGGEGCACKPGYVIKQEDPLVCVRRYQCDLEDMGHNGAKGAMGTKGSTGVKGAMGAKGSVGATGAMEAMGAMGAMGAKGSMGVTGAMGAMDTMGAMEAKGVKGVKSSSAYPPFPSWPSPPTEF